MDRIRKHGARRIDRILCIILVLSALVTAFSGCSGGGDRGAVYEDMKEAFEQAGLLSSNIGLFSKTEKDGSVSYGECGSGVIFAKDEDGYYALTAAHVVSVENARLLVFTVNTEMKTDQIPGIDGLNVLSRDVYETMYPAELLYASRRDDLAVIRFETDESLAVMEIADSDPGKGDRIMCVGNPKNEWFSISYGKVTSGIEKFGEALNCPSNAMKHSSYINVGSSGGAAINEDMKLAGITPGAAISPDGKSFKYGVLIPPSEIKLCLEDWKR